MKSKVKKSKEFITKDMIIAEAIEKYPEIVPALLELGIACVGCAISSFETLEQGLVGHGGYSEGEIKKIINELNDLISVERKNKDS